MGVEGGKGGRSGHLVLFLLLELLPADSPLLLALKLVVQQKERFLVGLGSTNDGEHPLAGIVVRLLGNGDLGTRQTANLGNLGSIAADDASHHVARNGDVLGAQVAGLGGGARTRRRRRTSLHAPSLTVRAACAHSGRTRWLVEFFETDVSMWLFSSGVTSGTPKALECRAGAA